jgi:UDP-N-acetylmuramoylalanine--D-glutamate ligase
MRLVILGGGESGVGTAILGKQKGYDVFVSDFGTITTKYQNVLNHYDIAWEQNGHTDALILNANEVMKSPGIPEKAPIVKALMAKNIPVISEIEFAARYTKAHITAITGSNGKTTTTLLTYHLLKEAGLNVGIAGNIGKSFAWQVAEENFDYYVLEISSFQLDGCFEFRPNIAILMNITPDHLDRYEYKFENYVASKFRITQSQKEEDFLILNADDDAILNYRMKNKINAKILTFSVEQEVSNGAFLNQNSMDFNIKEQSFSIAKEVVSMQGKHNIKNAMAAVSTAALLNIRKQTIRESMMNFQGVPHRLEHVAKVQNVTYVNDSKATNVNSVFYALEGIKAPIVWIAGGVDKGNDYLELMPLVREKVKAIVCLGIDNKKLIHTFGDVVDTLIEVDSMEEAVRLSQSLSESGDTVLLSPACASFDLFENYEDRGNQFKEAVRNL